MRRTSTNHFSMVLAMRSLRHKRIGNSKNVSRAVSSCSMSLTSLDNLTRQQTEFVERLAHDCQIRGLLDVLRLWLHFVMIAAALRPSSGQHFAERNHAR